MKAKVVEIQSRSYLLRGKPNPHRVIALQFDFGLVFGGPTILRLPESELGLVGIALDDEVEVHFHIDREALLQGEYERQ